MDTPLYKALIKYKKDITSFHMPGHKFGETLGLNNIPLLELDATEVPGLDNLYEAEDIIAQAQRKMSQRYNSKDTIFLTNGSTAGIIASILATCKPGDLLIVARNCHHSVWSALVLAEVMPIYITPTYDENTSMLGGIVPTEVENLLKVNPNVKGVILVSPTYEGLISNINQIAETVHKYNKVLIVDEAHGAHFAWHNMFPKSALKYGADIVINSMHKTLPTLTQSGLLHIGSDRVDKHNLLKSLQLVQTSSPSYMMMGLMDYVRAYMEEQGEVLWNQYHDSLLKSRERLNYLQNLQLLTEGTTVNSSIYDIDKSKIVVLTNNSNITGLKLSEILRDEYHIQVEAALDNYIIAISTIADTPCNLDKLCYALIEIDSRLKPIATTTKELDFNNIGIPSKLNPREVHFADKEEILLENSEGRICAANIMIYPPGIPIICVGEIFSKAAISYIINNSENLIGIKKEEEKILLTVVK